MTRRLTGRTTPYGALAAAAALVLGLTACSGGDTDEPAAATTTPTPTATSAVDLPDGVTLTDAGTVLAVGKPATVGYPVGKAASAVTVTVTKVRPGKPADLEGWVVDAKDAGSTPYYVEVGVRNDGPDPLGGAAVPVVAADASGTYVGATSFKGGTFSRCEGGALPKGFAPGDGAKRCLVFLAKPGKPFTTVQVRTDDLAAPVSWQIGR